MDTSAKDQCLEYRQLFCVSHLFVLGYKIGSKLTSILPIVVGAMIATFWQVVPVMGLFLFCYIVLRSIYLQIVLGAIMMGLGVRRLFQEKKTRHLQ